VRSRRAASAHRFAGSYGAMGISTEGEVIGTLPATFELIGERLKVIA